MLSSRVQGRPVSVAAYTVTDTQLTTAPDGTGGATTSTTTSTHYYTVTVAALARSMPPTAVEPRGAMSRLARTVLRPGDCATGNAVFDRRFRIRTSDPAAVHGWCTPQLIAAHLDRHLPTWSTYATELFTYQTGRLDPTTIPHHTSQVVLLAALLDQTAT